MAEEPGPAPPREPVGVPVPEDHVGAFVAEVFEDPERATSWETVVEALVAANARSAWEELAPADQVAEVIAKADAFDARAIDHLETIDLDGPPEAAESTFAEARRLRRNADRLRDGIADAFASGHVTADDLVAAVDAAGFETQRIAERERLLEQVVEAHEFDYRPYGGTLLDEGAGGRNCGDALRDPSRSPRR